MSMLISLLHTEMLLKHSEISTRESPYRDIEKRSRAEYAIMQNWYSRQGSLCWS